MILLCFVFSLHGNYLKNCPKYHNCKVSRWAQIEFLKTYELYHLASCSAFDNKTKLNTCNCTDYCKCKKVILDIMSLFFVMLDICCVLLQIKNLGHNIHP